MIPYQYSETVAVAEIPSYQDNACVTYCDLEAKTRCKTGVTIAPGLCPTSFRDSVIVYVDSTRRRYVSRVDYTTKLKPTSYSDTSFTRPRAAKRSFASWVDHHADSQRKWYRSAVELQPRKYTSSATPRTSCCRQELRNSSNQKWESFADRKSEASSMSMSADASMESLDYLSDGGRIGGSTSSSPETPSPLRLTTVSTSLHDVSRPETTTTTITYSSFRRELNGNDSGYHDDNANELPTMHRSGPFVYNTTRRRGHTTSGFPDDDATNSFGYDDDDLSRRTQNGHIKYPNSIPSRGYDDTTPNVKYRNQNGINGYHLPEDPEEDLLMDL